MINKLITKFRSPFVCTLKKLLHKINILHILCFFIFIIVIINQIIDFLSCHFQGYFRVTIAMSINFIEVEKRRRFYHKKSSCKILLQDIRIVITIFFLILTYFCAFIISIHLFITSNVHSLTIMMTKISI